MRQCLTSRPELFDVAEADRVTKIGDSQWALKTPIRKGEGEVASHAKKYGSEPTGVWVREKVKRGKQTFDVQRLYRLVRATIDLSGCDRDQLERMAISWATANIMKTPMWLASADDDGTTHMGTYDLHEALTAREQSTRGTYQSVTREEKGFINALKALGLDPATMKAEDIAALVKPKTE